MHTLVSGQIMCLIDLEKVTSSVECVVFKLWSSSIQCVLCSKLWHLNQ